MGVPTPGRTVHGPVEKKYFWGLCGTGGPTHSWWTPRWADVAVRDPTYRERPSRRRGNGVRGFHLERGETSGPFRTWGPGVGPRLVTVADVKGQAPDGAGGRRGGES